jgi:diguanylate cyclase (GGDEF)-like protein
MQTGENRHFTRPGTRFGTNVTECAPRKQAKGIKCTTDSTHPPGPYKNNMKTLVVEDAKTSLAVVCHHLERLGNIPVPASCGAQAIELFQSERPDLVLLDVVLPDMDGYTVARRIRDLEKPGEWTPIIFLTAMSGDADLEKGIAAGGDDYLQKPVSDVVLRAKIRAMQRIVQMRHSLLVLTRKLDAANQELKRLSAVDGLTGVANRRMFDEALEREWRRSMRQGTELAIVMCDVDFFKKFNDTYGHQAGDECLKKVASAMAKAMERGGDLLARYGGEEFSIILPDTKLGGAAFVAERMRHSVAQLKMPHAGSHHGQVTISCGVSAFVASPETSPEALLLAADQALYQAKQAGRNQVCRMSTAPAPCPAP